jgi:hypothetical protein
MRLLLAPSRVDNRLCCAGLCPRKRFYTLKLVAVAIVFAGSLTHARAMTAERVVVRLAADNSSGVGGRWIKARALEWAEKTGNTLEYIDRPNDPTATIYEFWKHWNAQSADIDVYMIDAT